MVQQIRLARAGVFCALVLTALTSPSYGGWVLANACPDCYGCGGCICIPNATGYGYFVTVWRQWPAESRPEKTFPQSVGAEVLPTPPPEPEPMEEPRGKDTTGRLPGLLEEIPPPEAGLLKLPEPGKTDEPSARPLVDPLLKDNLPTVEAPLKPDASLPLPGPGLDGSLPGLPADTASPAPSGPLDTAPLPETPLPESPLPKTKTPPPGVPASPKDGKDKAEPPAAEPPAAAPKAGDGGRSPERPPAAALQTNWMSALRPGFCGDMYRPAVLCPSTTVRDTLHQSPAEPGAQPPALEGYCSVELSRNERWVPGDPRYTAVHQGRTYSFAGGAQRKRFLADPERYAPVDAGHDPVLAADGSGDVPGKTDYCVTYDGRLYMFSGPDSLERFQKNPKRYARPRPK